MEDKEKIKDNKYKVVSVLSGRIKDITVLLSVLSLLLLGIRKWDLTFDDQRQKNYVIYESDVRLQDLIDNKDEVINKITNIDKDNKQIRFNLIQIKQTQESIKKSQKKQEDQNTWINSRLKELTKGR